MLMPIDYGRDALFHKTTRSLMQVIAFEHGGESYDSKYPDGIPTSMVIALNDGSSYDSGLVMYPSGHARNTTADLADILSHKFELLGQLAMDNPSDVVASFKNIASLHPSALCTIMDFTINQRESVD
jgi:2-methylcitrate dehydratase